MILPHSHTRNMGVSWTFCTQGPGLRKEATIMARAQRRDPDKEGFWRRMLRDWRGSGLSGRDFCAEHRLSQASFYAWRREIAERDRERSAGRAQVTRAARRQPQPAQPAFVRVAL